MKAASGLVMDNDFLSSQTILDGAPLETVSDATQESDDVLGELLCGPSPELSPTVEGWLDPSEKED